MFWKKKQQKNDYSKIIGLTNTGEIRFSNQGEILIPIARAVLCFLLTVGSICGYASCFSAQFNINLILIVLLGASLIIGFVRNSSSKFLKNACYIIFLFAFIFLIFRYYRYVNSGYHALVNMTYASLENYLDIPALVHYEELIENSYATITIFLIFLGIFELLLFHMWIGERINLLTISLVSLGPYIVPLFIELFPEDFYLICILTAFIALLILCFGMHINKHPDKKLTYSVHKKRNPWSYKIHGFSYGVNGISYSMSIIASLLMALCITFITNLAIPYSSFQLRTRDSALKNSMEDDVKYIVTFGLSGYFNRYNATGGLNDGRLGGIYSVRPDYETDLTVRYVPLSSQPIYLRGFMGVAYTDRQWHSPELLLDEELINETIYKKLCEDYVLIDEYNNLSDVDILSSPMRMDIKNVGASIYYSYAPYYTDPNLLDIYPYLNANQSYFLRNKSRTYSYYPFMNSTEYNTPLMDEKLLAMYLQVPSSKDTASTREEIIEFLVEQDLCTEYITAAPGINNNLSGTKLQTVISRLSNCMSTEFVYSMNPGITPQREDYVGYFLNGNKKGFCAHFATSSVLILRTLGIPARYVEGYVLTSEDLAEGKIVEDADVSSYINTSVIDMELSVVDVDIADDKAHAWVEYYDPEFGWRIFEATTASMDASSDSDFWSSLYAMFQQDVVAEDDETFMNGNNTDTISFTDILTKIIFITLGTTAVIVLCFYGYGFIRQYRSYHRARRNINVRNYYKIICRHIIRRYPEFDYLLTHKEQLDFIKMHYRLSKRFQKNSLEILEPILEQSAFSHEEITNAEYMFSMKLLKLLRRNITFHF